MPRKKVQEVQETDDLELQEGSPGTALLEESPDSPPMEEAAPAAGESAETLDETSRLLVELDGGDPAAEPPDTGDGPPQPPDGEDAPEAEPPRRGQRKATATKTTPPDDGASERRPHTPARGRADGVLTIEAKDSIATAEDEDETIWHEIRNAYRVRRPLTGKLGGVEETADKKTIAVLDYKGVRVVIPMKEMMLRLGRSPSGNEYATLMKRQSQVLSTMLGAELDFVVKGLDSKTKAVVASRKDAMLRKRKTFYQDIDAAGMPRVYAGRVVQARVIAVAEKVVRVEVFGVECSILARDLAWDWIGDARDRFSVGDKILVRIHEVNAESLEDITIRADVKSVSNTTSRERLKLCRIEGKYAGTVTDVRRGVVYIRLNNGVNAIAHACYDYRMPGKKDDVCFAVTRLDEESGIAIGIITRIIKQNL